jgi:hypothetical protein
MSPEVSGWLEVLKGGGNAAIIVLAIIAVRVAQVFLKALGGIVETMNKNHAESVANQEAIKRAIVSRDPGAERFFASGKG